MQKAGGGQQQGGGRARTLSCSAGGGRGSRVELETAQPPCRLDPSCSDDEPVLLLRVLVLMLLQRSLGGWLSSCRRRAEEARPLLVGLPPPCRKQPSALELAAPSWFARIVIRGSVAPAAALCEALGLTCGLSPPVCHPDVYERSGPG